MKYILVTGDVASDLGKDMMPCSSDIVLKPGDVRIRSITIGMWHISPKPLP
jgi:CTP synthase (UTP-ammonia lyase)